MEGFILVHTKHNGLRVIISIDSIGVVSENEEGGPARIYEKESPDDAYWETTETLDEIYRLIGEATK